MFESSNLWSLLTGGTIAREMRETRQSWDQTQKLWRASPLGKTELSDLSLEIVRSAIDDAERVPATPILVAICQAVEALLRLEDIDDFGADWPLIESDASVAVEFRKMVARRRRWVADYERVHGAFKRILNVAIAAYFKALPESCFETWDEEAGDTFDVPLIDLVHDPSLLVERLFSLPYDDESLRYDLFYRLRDLFAGNLLVASGFLRSDNVHLHERKLVGPAKQKDKTGAELAALYLEGSPLKELTSLTVPFKIPAEARFEHCHIVGGTGHGKTQLMQKMIHADLVAAQRDQRSVIVIDSQGDLINKLVRLELFSPSAPDSLADRLVLIDPSDVEYPAALNLFDAHLERVRDYGPADRERVLNGVIELYELFFGAFLGAELTQKQGVIFKYLARLMLAIPKANIHTLMAIMEDAKPFKPHMDQLDGSARHFFETEFFHPSFTATKKQILRRLWGVLSTSAFERMFGQPNNKLDLFEAMNDGKIILVSTAKDLLKRDGSQLLGRFFIAMITQAALERSTIPEHKRTPTFVYVDEAQEYFDESIETILNQARKYRVSLTLAHQTLDQLSPRLRSAILANTSIKCAGGVSAKDARALADELRTSAEFIDGMKRRGPRTEFALWVKHQLGQAIRLSVPLGFLERQNMLADGDFDELLTANRERYCGKVADVPAGGPEGDDPLPEPPSPRPDTPGDEPVRTPRSSEPPHEPDVLEAPSKPAEPPAARTTRDELPKPAPRSPSSPVEDRALGKGGARHRYLQTLVKELAEQVGLKATIEAQLPNGRGQVDVLFERDGVVAAVEISVTTPIEHERENLKKCLDCGYPRVAVVLAKSKKAQSNYQAGLREGIPDADRERVVFLTPEEIPDFIASLTPPPESAERIVKGYRVKGELQQTSPEDAQARRSAVARLIARSINKGRS